MNKKLIEDYRKIVKPFVSKHLLSTDYEGLGKLDKLEFEKDFDTICDLAIQALREKNITTFTELTEQKASEKKFVTVTRTSGSKIALNKDWITAMVPQTNGTRVFTGDGEPIYVLEPMEEMLNMIEGW